MPHLSPPTTAVHASYLTAGREYQNEGRQPHDGDLSIDTPAAFAAHVAALRRDPRSGAGRVTAPPMTLYWWVDGPTYLGRTAIWHRLDADLVLTGHIGYDIRPTARGHGHATAMLTAALPCAHALGINPAILTAHTGNHASHAVIQHNGGQIIDRRGDRIYYELPTTPPRTPQPHAHEPHPRPQRDIRFWEDQPGLPYGALLRCIETYCHPSSWEGAQAQLQALAKRPGGPEMDLIRSQLSTAALDPTVLNPQTLQEAAEYSDGNPSTFLKNLWVKLYGSEQPSHQPVH